MGRKKPTTQEYIEKARVVHGRKYDYSNITYSGSFIKISIFCPDHGYFIQTSASHLTGRGCPNCKKTKISKARSLHPNVWNYSDWKKAAERSSLFDSFKVYLIRCSDQNEVFYKIGKTYKSIKQRFRSSKLPYNFEIIETISGDARLISKLEHHIKKDNKEISYIPSIPFGGMHECLSKPPKRTLNEYFNQLLQMS